jgi:hypothetical protein
VPYQLQPNWPLRISPEVTVWFWKYHSPSESWLEEDGFQTIATKRSQRRSDLDILVNKKMLSSEGRNALIKTTDPFHDLEIDMVGIPDGLPEKSIIREVKKSFTIASPLADKTQPFDVHIYTLPERQFIETTDSNHLSWWGSLGTNGEFTQSASAPANVRFGPLVVVAVPAGQATTPASGAWPPVGSISLQVLDFNDYFYGQSREVFSAFEVHNVTNKLNVGGTVTTYRLPQFTYDSQCAVVDNSGQCRNSSSKALVSRLPPGTIEDALLLAGSRQWEAEFGAYCVETFQMEHNLPQAAEFAVRAFVAGDIPGGLAALQAGTPLPATFGFMTDKNDTEGIRMYQGQPYKPVAKDTSGAYFTGLPGTSQLTITVRKGIETFPSFTDPLVTLARETPDHDPIFFELYKRIAQEMPSGVAVGENASGDFWDSILGIISDVAPTIGSAAGPLGAALGTMVSVASKAGQNARNKPKVNGSDFKGGKATVTAPASVRTNIPKKRNA